MPYNEKEIETLKNNTCMDFIETDEEKQVFEKYRDIPISKLTLDDKQTIYTVLSVPRNRQLKYAQQKYYSAFLKVLEIYRALPAKLDLLTTPVATITLEIRLFLGSGTHSPNRSKGYNSFLQNIGKEFKRKLQDLPPNPSKKDIDDSVSKAVSDICKDLYGATAIFHMANDMSQYCEDSDDPQVALFYQQFLCIENYLMQSDRISRLSPEEPDRNSIIDISDAFIDGRKNPKAPSKVAPLEPKNIKTQEDYYNQLISVLTLLTNASMFEIIEPETGKTNAKRIVSEIDISDYELIHLVELSEPAPKNNFEYLERIIEFGKKYFFTDHEPFDVQLKKAIAEKEKESKKEYFRMPLSKKDKEMYQVHLEHLRKNLDLLKADRLNDYILQLEIVDIIKRLYDLPNFKIDIVSTKTVAKENGFSSAYYILQVNDLVEFELQIQDEFRAYMSREGNAAHNSRLPGKSFDITQFFELNNPSHNEETNRKHLEVLCNSLHCIKYNSVKSKFSKSKMDQQYLNKLQELVSFAKDRLKIKDTFTFENKLDDQYHPYQTEPDLYEIYKLNTKKITVPFEEYIKTIIDYYCARFGDIQANHSEGDHNTILIKNKTDKDILLSFFKNRIGLSALAYMIIDKYTIKSPNTTRESYSTIASEEEASQRMGESTKKALAGVADLTDENGNVIKFNPLFYPQGQNQNDTEDIDR